MWILKTYKIPESGVYFLPACPNFLGVTAKAGQIAVVAEIDTDNKEQECLFLVLNSGDRVPTHGGSLRYIGSSGDSHLYSVEPVNPMVAVGYLAKTMSTRNT